MHIKRMTTHLFLTHWQVKRVLPPQTLLAIEKANKASETAHVGEIRFVVEGAVEIVADRGVHVKVRSAEWQKICRTMEVAFGQGKYEEGAVSGIQAVTKHLVRHFPASCAGRNEQPDKPVML